MVVDWVRYVPFLVLAYKENDMKFNLYDYAMLAGCIVIVVGLYILFV